MSIGFRNGVPGSFFRDFLTNPKNLAVAFFIVGIIGVGIGTRIENLYALFFPIAILGGAICYVGYRSEFWKGMSTRIHDQEIPIRLGLSIYFLFVAALAIVQFENPSGRTLVHHGLTVMLYVVPFYIIVMNRRALTGLGLVILSGIAHRVTIYYSSALYIGNDVFIHNDIVTQIVQVGTMAPLQDSKYFYAPFYHLSVAEGSLITELGTRHSAFLLSTVTSMVILSLVVFAIGTLLGDELVGALASLLYISADFVIQRSIQPSTTLLGIVFFALGTVTVIQYMRTGEKRQLLLTFTFLVALLFTHQLSAVVFTVCTLGFLSFYSLYDRSVTRRSLNVFSAIGCSIFLDFVITRQSGPGSREFIDYLLVRFTNHLFDASPDARVQTHLPDDPGIVVGGSASLTTIHILGTSILLGAAVFGTLYWLSDRHNRNIQATAFGLGGMTFLSLTVVLAGPLVGMRTVIPYRWFPFIYLPLAVLGAVLFLLAFRSTIQFANRRSIVAGVLIVVLVSGGYFLVMTGNFAGSYDDPLFDEAQGAEKYGVSEQERHMYEHITRYDSGDTVYTGDHRAMRMLFHFYGVNSEPIRIEYGDPNSIPNGNEREIIVNRAYLSMPQAQFELSYQGQTNRVHGAVPIDELDQTKRSTVYDVGDHDLQRIR